MRLIITILVFVGLLGCADKNAIPKDVLPVDKMELVMYDMIRAGEFLNGYVLFRDSVTDKTAECLKWYNKIYQIHKITEADFKRSYAWYQARPLMMQEVLDSIMVIPTPPLPQALADSSRKRDSISRAADSVKNRGRLIKPLLIQKNLISDTARRRR